MTWKYEQAVKLSKERMYDLVRSPVVTENVSLEASAATTSSVTSTDCACAFVSDVSALVPNCGPWEPGAIA